jgi:hypothetical protein
MAEPASKQAIVDELADMADAAGIDPDEAQEIFARAIEFALIFFACRRSFIGYRQRQTKMSSKLR